jgi:hypothetical protein
MPSLNDDDEDINTLSCTHAHAKHEFEIMLQFYVIGRKSVGFTSYSSV